MNIGRALLCAIVTIAVAGCGILHRVDSDQPIPLPPPGPAGPPQEPVVPISPMGCVVVIYDVDQKGVPSNAEIYDSQPPGFYDAEVLHLIEALRFKHAPAHRAARAFAFAPEIGTHTRKAAATLCKPTPGKAELNSEKN